MATSHINHTASTPCVWDDAKHSASSKFKKRVHAKREERRKQDKKNILIDTDHESDDSNFVEKWEKRQKQSLKNVVKGRLRGLEKLGPYEQEERPLPPNSYGSCWLLEIEIAYINDNTSWITEEYGGCSEEEYDYYDSFLPLIRAWQYVEQESTKYGNVTRSYMDGSIKNQINSLYKYGPIL